MKEVIENGQAYVVSDNYPNAPYTKYIKERGTAAEVEKPKTITERLEAIEEKLDQLLSK